MIKANIKRVLYAIFYTLSIVLIVLFLPDLFNTDNNPNETDYVYKDLVNKEISNNDDIYSGLMSNGWIYYANNADRAKLYKIKLDGSSKTKLNNKRSEVFALEDGFVYYTDMDKGAIYRIGIDGKNNTLIFGGKKKKEYNARGLKLMDGWIYYEDSYDIYKVHKMRIDGTEDTLLTNGIYNIGTTITNEWIYYIYYQDHTLHRTSLDGKETMIFNDVKTFDYYVTEDWVFVLNSFDENGAKIYKISSDGSRKQLVLDQYVSNFDIFKNNLYYKNYGDINKVCLDGSNNTYLCGTPPILDMTVKGNWIYFTPAPGIGNEVWRENIN